MAKQPIKPKRPIDVEIEQIKKDFDNAMTPNWYKKTQRLNSMLSAYNKRKRMQPGN